MVKKMTTEQEKAEVMKAIDEFEASFDKLVCVLSSHFGGTAIFKWRNNAEIYCIEFIRKKVEKLLTDRM